MAIEFTGVSSKFNSGAGATASGSYTCPGGSNRIMFISITNYSGSDDLTSVTYAGVSATLVAKKGFNTAASPTNYSYLYYLVAPTTGSNTLSATRTSTTSNMQIMCSTYDGASQTGVPDASATNAVDSATSISTSVTTTVANCWTVLAGGSQRNLTASTGSTIRVGSGSQEIIADSAGNITTAGSTSMALSLSSSNAAGTIIASFAPASGTTNLKVKAGTYTGNGSTTQAITGIGFQPKVVIIMATTGTGDASGALYKTDGMTTGATGQTSGMGENGLLTTGQIDSLDADGFTVRDQKNINTTAYYYLALAGTSCKTGTYTGDGTDNRAITGVGFQPRWVVTQGGTFHTRHKSRATGISTDSAQGFSSIADAANLIQSLDSDGFTLGNDASGTNVSGSSYFYFAVNDYNVTSGTYTGNGSDNRTITGVGFTPNAVFVKDTAVTNQAGGRTGEAGDLTSKMRANTAPAANLIQSLDSDGFTIGTDGIVNTNTSTYYWVALYAVSTPVASTDSIMFGHFA